MLDEVVKIYYTHLLEMAARASPLASAIDDDQLYPRFEEYIKKNPGKEIADGGRMHSASQKGLHVFSHGGSPVLYSSIYETKINHNGKIIDAMSQGEIGKRAGATPKGFVRDSVLSMVSHYNKPLVSDSSQTDKGYGMWARLVPVAISRGMHVYHYDQTGVHKLNLENQKEHVESTKDSAHHKLVISPFDMDK